MLGAGAAGVEAVGAGEEAAEAKRGPAEGEAEQSRGLAVAVAVHARSLRFRARNHPAGRNLPVEGVGADAHRNRDPAAETVRAPGNARVVVAVIAQNPRNAQVAEAGARVCRALVAALAALAVAAGIALRSVLRPGPAGRVGITVPAGIIVRTVRVAATMTSLGCVPVTAREDALDKIVPAAVQASFQTVLVAWEASAVPVA